jgi:ERO1-like protein beta
VALLSRVRTDAAGGSRPGKAAGWSLDTGGSESYRPGGTSSASRYDEANVWSVQPASPAEAGVLPGAREEQESSLQYVSLLANPEGYTGYAGPKASRIWQAIYGENCFTGPLEGMCLEERVFYRMLSGLQMSINTHVAMTYSGGEGADEGADIYGERGKAGGSAGAGIAAARTLMGRAFTTALNALSRAGGYGPFPPEPEAYAPGNGGTLSSAASISRLVVTPGLKPSVAVYKERIGGHPERLKNLYFTFLFVVRAVAKAKPQLERMELSTGDAAEDAATRAALTRLLDVEVPSVLAGFDESRMFQVTTDEFLASSGSAPAAGGGAGTCPPVLHGLGDLHELQHRYLAHVGRKAALREAFRDKYRNISRIMDCVGCEKCRLWGKLQFLGLGTAMKILFADADTTGAPGSPDLSIHVSRNELVALINVLHRLSMSMAALHVMRDLELSERLGSILLSVLRGVGALALGLALGRALLWMKTGQRGVRAPEVRSKAEEPKSD